MAIFHDLGEARSGDQNWVHKRYVKFFEEEIMKDQLSDLTEEEKLIEIMQEYEERVSLESQVARDADLLDQILLLKEYENNGNKEAEKWLKGKAQLKLTSTESAKRIALEIHEANTNDWWSGIWTDKRRK